ncbi:16036_t:CDS:1 [Funneliformis mosseae]|uniref:16036_t:CDS:1 n=1 Tax=Funneliformis mosseae TaxID=27381 RepID=A0A9N9CMZ0_FUNMO|nr:16036_t:CDS:1 [Funneliformis mosseae]
MDEILELLRAKPSYKVKQGSDDFMENRDIVHGKSLKLTERVKYKYSLKKYEMPTELKTIFERPHQDVLRRLSSQLNANNYSKFFSELLYAEEYKTNEDLKRYDRQKVKLVKKSGDYFKMKIHKRALAEKRLSVLPGDYIFVVKCGDKKAEAYQGFVHEVLKSSIDLKFDESFSQEVYNSNVRFDVRFTFNRVSMRRMHQTVRNPKVEFSRLFPQNHQNFSANDVDFQNIKFYTILNYYQRRAVAIIKSGIHQPWPFIVFGPPGTG